MQYLEDSMNNKINKNYPFFEGWYFKHDNGKEIVTFIVGRNIDSTGAGSAFIQVLTPDNSYNINYPLSTFRFFKKQYVIKVGNSYFTDRGIFVDIYTKDLKLKGKLTYSKLKSIKYPLMGPFNLIPKMECRHEIISMQHKVFGNLTLNSKTISFNNGIGYIESDMGHSFPKNYTWLQCNNFDNIKASLMVAIADVPILNRSFTGVLSVINYKNKEFRLATYLGAKVDFCNNYCIIIKQRKYKLVIKFNEKSGQKLFAPKNGCMSKIIHECCKTNARFWFYYGDNLIFYGNTDKCSYEIVK